MTARKAISVRDENGMLSIFPGTRPIPWSRMDRELADSFAYEERDPEVSYETLLGWGPWTFGILMNGEVVCFVDGDEPPAVVAGISLAGYPEDDA